MTWAEGMRRYIVAVIAVVLVCVVVAVAAVSSWAIVAPRLRRPPPSPPRMILVRTWVTHPTIVLPTAAPVQTSTPYPGEPTPPWG